MYFLYSLLLTVAAVVLSPKFLFDAITKGKYAAGFRQRLGFVPKLSANGRQILWVHCVSVGETNAVRELISQIKSEHPDIRIVVSTTTRTGQQLARSLFAETAEAIIYFPFDWKNTVRRALRRISPSVILLTETELWFNFLREANKFGAKVSIVNGRLSERSNKRYSYLGRFMRRVLSYPDLALMQDKADASRLMSLGVHPGKVRVTGNLKFDQAADAGDSSLTDEFRARFDITADAPLIVAASTHSPEEQHLLEAFKEVWKNSTGRLPRLMLVPRHPERFDEVEALIKASGFSYVRRSSSPAASDQNAEIILLDSVGELRSVYSLAEIVFVGGSLIKHGGQSIFEPAAVGASVICGPHMTNFSAAIEEFRSKDAIGQLPEVSLSKIPQQLADSFTSILNDSNRRATLGANALSVMQQNRGAVQRTLEYLAPFLRTNGK